MGWAQRLTGAAEASGRTARTAESRIVALEAELQSERALHGQEHALKQVRASSVLELLFEMLMFEFLLFVSLYLVKSSGLQEGCPSMAIACTATSTIWHALLYGRNFLRLLTVVPISNLFHLLGINLAMVVGISLSTISCSQWYIQIS